MISLRTRWYLIAGVLAFLCAAFVFFVPPIPQSLEYLDFADQRTLFGIPNFSDVTSNVFFLVFGILGVADVYFGKSRFVNSHDRIPYLAFFLMIFFTGIGSTYFHLYVGIDRLFWDRMPISLAFMALTAGVVGDRTRPGLGPRILPVLLGMGAASVFAWSIGESAGHGDLRFYALVQYGSMVALLPMLLYIPARYTGNEGFWWATGCYVVAKGFEVWDRPVFDLTTSISGHTLKHVAAGLGTYFVWRMLRTRRPTQA